MKVENKYLILFFLRWKGFYDFLEKMSRSLLAEVVERTGSVLLFGPLLARKFVRPDIFSYLTLVLVSVFMPYFPLSSIFTLFFGLMGSAFFFLGQSALTILHDYMVGNAPTPGLAPVIPGVSIGPYYVPFLEGWLSLLIIFILHEGMHGAISLRKKVDIEDAAAVLLLFVPVAAYVMPKQEEFNALHPKDKIDVLAAGPSSNAYLFVIASILLFISGQFLSPYLDAVLREHVLGLKVIEVPDYVVIEGRKLPSLVKGILKPGDIIVSINGKKIYSALKLREVLKEANMPLLKVTVLRNGEYVTLSVENRHYLGVRGFETAWRTDPPISYRVVSFLIRFLAVLAMLNLAVAVVNALPFSIFDGGQAINEYEKIVGRRMNLLRFVAAALIVINVLPWFFT